MDLEARKYAFIKELFQLEKSEVMDKLEKLLKNEKEHVADTVEEYNKQLDDADKRIDNGKFYTQKEIEESAKKW